MTTSFPQETENPTMTLATFNRYVDLVTEESKTRPLSGKHGRTHAGARETAIMSLLRGNRKRGKHAKVAGRHARPPRAFF